MNNKPGFKGALPILAKMLANSMNVQVQFGASEASLAGDVILLPLLPLESKTGEILALGYIVRESGKLRNSEPELAPSEKNVLRRAIWQVLEDVWVEKCTMAIFPGSRKTLNDLMAHFISEGKISSANEFTSPGVMLMSYINAKLRSEVLKQAAFVEITSTAHKLLAELMPMSVLDSLDDLLFSLQSSVCTEDNVYLADQIVSLIADAADVSTDASESGVSGNSEQTIPSDSHGKGDSSESGNSESTNSDSTDLEADESSKALSVSKAEKANADQPESATEGNSKAEDQKHSKSEIGEAKSEGEPTEEVSDGSSKNGSKPKDEQAIAPNSKKGGATDASVSGEDKHSAVQPDSSSNDVEDTDSNSESSKSNSISSRGNGSGKGSSDSSSADKNTNGANDGDEDANNSSSVDDANTNCSKRANGKDSRKKGALNILADDAVRNIPSVDDLLKKQLSTVTQNDDGTRTRTNLTESRLAAASKPGDELLEVTRESTSALRRKLADLLEAQNLSKREIAKKGQKVIAGRVWRMKYGNTRVFERETEGLKTNTKVQILLDRSGSMSGRLNLACQAVFSLALSLAGADRIEGAVAAFPADDGISESGVLELTRFGERAVTTASRYASLVADGGTPMDDAILWAIYNLINSDCDRRILFIATDGQPDHNRKQSTVKTLAMCKALEIEVIGLGINVDIGFLIKDSEMINDIAEMPGKVFQMMTNKLRQLKAA